MQKSIVILLSTSMFLISKDIFLRKENVSTEIIMSMAIQKCRFLAI